MNKHKLALILIIVIASFLRLYKLNVVPNSLFGDELDVGYHAYSILKTGKDYHGNFMPLHFQSLAEYRTPLYLYSAVPTVALWGISPYGVRTPAALYGIAGVYVLYLFVKKCLKNENVALLSAFLLAISPWHIQYSRAAFEVTQLLLFLILGLYFFYISIEKKGKFLWLSVLLLVLTPMIYSTAKLFTPFLMLFLFLANFKTILTLNKKQIMYALGVGAIVGSVVTYATLFAGGSQRFGYISVFSDPTLESEVGYSRSVDAYARHETGIGLQPTKLDRAFHNKVTFIGTEVVSNYLQAFSTNFLFIKGDLNLRHSIDGMGEFYWIEMLTLLIGLVVFFSGKIPNKYKGLFLFWIAAGVIPSSITKDGGMHATRLILILPPMIILSAYGFAEIFKRPKKGYLRLFSLVVVCILFAQFVYYQHLYWVHNPFDSERWWHNGFKEVVQTIKENEGTYDKFVITMKGEPAWIFFAGWYQYPPDKWQAHVPDQNSTYLDGFGDVSYIDKFYFGQPDASRDIGIFEIGNYLDSKTIYVASAQEIGENLLAEPEKKPSNLKLIKAIAYPSGTPAFYVFAKNDEEE